MNTANKADLLYSLSKGNHTTPADGRIEGLGSKFANKAAIFKHVMDAASSHKRDQVSDSESESDDISEEESILELTDDEEDYSVGCKSNLQAFSKVKLVIQKRSESPEMESPCAERIFMRQAFSPSIFAKKVQIISSIVDAKSEESIEQKMVTLNLNDGLKGYKTGKSSYSGKSMQMIAANETNLESGQAPAMMAPVSSKMGMMQGMAPQLEEQDEIINLY